MFPCCDEVHYDSNKVLQGTVHAGLPQSSAPSKNIIMLFMAQKSRDTFVNSVI